jgi:hypothetical protein
MAGRSRSAAQLNLSVGLLKSQITVQDMSAQYLKWRNDRKKEI